MIAVCISLVTLLGMATQSAQAKSKSKSSPHARSEPIPPVKHKPTPPPAQRIPAPPLKPTPPPAQRIPAPPLKPTPPPAQPEPTPTPAPRQPVKPTPGPPTALPSDGRKLNRVDGSYRKTPCTSDWMTQVSAEGVGKEFVTSIWPTWNARFRLGPFPDDVPPPDLQPMWNDVVRCLEFSRNRSFGLTSSQVSSMKKQLACHAYYGIHAIFGGSEWDLEAYRRNIPWDQVYKVWDRCGWS